MCAPDVQLKGHVHLLLSRFPAFWASASAELRGILQEEPGGSESSSLAMHGEEPGRQGVCAAQAPANQSQAPDRRQTLACSPGHSSGMEIEMSLMVN